MGGEGSGLGTREEGAMTGDMLKSVYDPDEDGIIALAQLDALVCSETEADAKVATHKSDASAHHTRYTDAEAVTAAKADADIADAITKKHDQAHTIVSHSDTTATGDELNELTGGGQTSLHSHPGGGTLPTPVNIPIKHIASATAWSNMPAALTEFPVAGTLRLKADLTNASQSRLIVRVATAPAANAKIKVQYSADEAAWSDLCSVTMPATGNKTNVGDWTDVPAGAKADTFLRLVGIDGDGVTDPTFGNITLQAK